MSVVVKKVRPYPIPFNLQFGSEAFVGDIQKLTQIGLLMTTYFKKLKPHDVINGSFILPVYKISFYQLNFKVVKLYERFDNETAPKSTADASTDGAGPPKEAPPKAPLDKPDFHYLVELHFQNLSFEQKVAITKFLQRISQR